MIKNFYNVKGKLIGAFKDGIFRKRVNPKKHKMRMFGGAYGIDKRIVEELVELGCKEIRIQEIDSSNIYRTDFETFTKNGIERDFDGKQIFLPMKFFEADDNKQQKLI